MKIDFQDSSTLTWLIMAVILGVAVTYTVLALKNKPPKMGFTVGENYTFPYDFNKGGWQVEVPDQLREISGITSMNPDQALAIQDEKGILFSVNINTGEIVSERVFDKDRDYEDVCLVGDHVFVLERDGDLYQLHLAGQDTVEKYETSFSYRNDVESLCYDPTHNRLLMAPKEGVPEGVTQEKGMQYIFGFDLIDRIVSSQPIMRISEKEIGGIIGSSKKHKFKPSAIAIHPKTGNLYVLASVGKVLLVMDKDKEEILHVQLLDSERFPQPEGMTFNAQGDLIIASEGIAPYPGTITRFSPKAAK